MKTIQSRTQELNGVLLTPLQWGLNQMQRLLYAEPMTPVPPGLTAGPTTDTGHVTRSPREDRN